MKSSKRIKSFTVKQFVFFIIALLIIATAITFLVLGLIDDYANIKNSILTLPNSSMKSKCWGIGFTWFGVIFTGVGSIILAFTLSSAAKLEERENEKQARRKQRLESMNATKTNTASDSTIIINQHK